MSPAGIATCARRRTKSRTLLRQFTSGHLVEPALVRTAIKVLGKHHSRSQLPLAASRRLRTMATSWRCCRSSMAKYCPGCGGFWEKVQERPDWRAATPHGRLLPSEPKGRGKGKEEQKGANRPVTTRPCQCYRAAAGASTATSCCTGDAHVGAVACAAEGKAVCPSRGARDIVDSRGPGETPLGYAAGTSCWAGEFIRAGARSSNTSFPQHGKDRGQGLAQAGGAAPGSVSALEKLRQDRASFEQGWVVYSQALMDLLTQQFQERTDTVRGWVRSEVGLG